MGQPEDRSKYSLVGRILNANTGSETRKMAAANPEEKAGPYLIVIAVIAVVVGVVIYLTR
jgi:hypothetical protein